MRDRGSLKPRMAEGQCLSLLLYVRANHEVPADKTLLLCSERLLLRQDGIR
jgi:hypothetical protein